MDNKIQIKSSKRFTPFKISAKLSVAIVVQTKGIVPGDWMQIIPIIIIERFTANNTVVFRNKSRGNFL